MQEVARLRVALRSKEEEVEKWKGEADKSISKEKDSRRALESARVAASDALRRCGSRSECPEVVDRRVLVDVVTCRCYGFGAATRRTNSKPTTKVG